MFSLRREAQRVRALERALDLSRGAQTRLESELEQAQTERDLAVQARLLQQQSPRAVHTRATPRLLPSPPPTLAPRRPGKDPTRGLASCGVQWTPSRARPIESTAQGA
jgi:hypothetical protein